MIAMADPAPSEQPAAGQSTSAASELSFTGGRRAAMVQALMGAGSGGGQPTPVDAPAAATATPDPAPPAEPAKPAAAAAPEARPDDAAAAAIRKQEIHLRRQLADERAQWQAQQAQEQATLKPKLEQLAQWEALMASAKDDPIAYLKAAGYTEADFDHVGRYVYAHSPEGSKDPKAKAQVHQTREQRALAAEIRELKEQQAAFVRQQQEHTERVQQQAQIDGYFSTIAKAVDESSPIVRGRLAAMPDVAKARLLEIAERLYVESGPSEHLRDVPDNAQIIKAYEAERRAELEADLRAMGLDPAVVLRAPAPTTGATAQPATGGAPVLQIQRSPTLTPGAGAPTQIAQSGRRSRDDLIKEVQRLHAVAKP